MSTLVTHVPAGTARNNHWVIPTGRTIPIRTLLTEPQRTNLCLRSEEFDTWSNVGTCNVTANNVIAPDGTATADLLTATVVGSRRIRVVTFTGNGEKCAAVFLKQGSSGVTDVSLFGASVARHRVRVTWTAGVPALTTNEGAGTRYPVQNYGNGWWRIMWSATGIVAAEENSVWVVPDPISGTGTVLAWSAQAENAVVPSSYIPTEATAVTRNADSLYWEIPSLVPQEMTVYTRSVNVGNFSTENLTAVHYTVGEAAMGGVLFRVFRANGAQSVTVQYNDGGGASNSSILTPSPLPAMGDVIETRAVLQADWRVLLGLSISGGSESVATVGAARGPAGAFAQPRLYLAGVSAGFQSLNAFTHVGIFRGTQTRTTCRRLTGVV
jgi:hypothetical protein